MSHFKTGDVVTIKSGGPAMTVYGYYTNREGDVVKFDCDWFDADGNNHRAGFHPKQLKLLTSEDIKAISSWFQEAQLRK